MLGRMAATTRNAAGWTCRGYWVGVSWLRVACALCLLPGFLLRTRLTTRGPYHGVRFACERWFMFRFSYLDSVRVSVCVPMYLSSEMNAVRRPVLSYSGSLPLKVETYTSTDVALLRRG